MRNCWLVSSGGNWVTPRPERGAALKVFGADLAQGIPDKGTPEWTLVSSDRSGTITEVRRPSSIPGLVAEIATLAGEDPFLLGVDIPVVLPVRPSRSRPFEGLLRKKFGVRIQTGGKPEDGRITGEQLLGALAGAGHACLTYPDRNSRNSGLAEIHPGAALKGLLWIGSRVGDGLPDSHRETFCRSYKVPAYRRTRGRIHSRGDRLHPGPADPLPCPGSRLRFRAGPGGAGYTGQRRGCPPGRLPVRRLCHRRHSPAPPGRAGILRLRRGA